MYQNPFVNPFAQKHQTEYKGNPENDLLKHKKRIYAPTQEAILEKLREIEEPELKAFASASYLTAGRVSEVLSMKYGDVKIYSKDRSRYAEIRLKTLKNRQEPLRMLNVPLFIGNEAQMFAYFNEVYEHRIGKIFKDQKSRWNVFQKMKKIYFECEVLDFKTREITRQEVRLHPHLLRHFRLSHLITMYNFPPFKLQKFAGWSSIIPAQTYISLSGETFEEEWHKYRYTYNKPKV